MGKMCEHKKLIVTIRDFGPFEQREDGYVFNEVGSYSKYHEGSWSTMDGYQEAVVGDVQCDDCNETFYDCGNMSIKEDHPMYTTVRELVGKLNKEYEKNLA